MLGQCYALFVVADTSLVAIQGRERLEQVCHAHNLQATADIERFIAALNLTREEHKAVQAAIAARHNFTTGFSVAGKGRYMLELQPINAPAGHWVLTVKLRDAGQLVTKPASPQRRGREAVSDDRGWALYLEHAPIPTAILSATGVVQRVNEAFRKLLKPHFAENTEWRFLECLEESSKEKVAANFAEIIGGKELAGSLEVQLAGDEQEETTLSLFVSRLEEGDEVQGFILHMIDLTEQKNLEMRFVHSQKMQAVGQLAGGIAHDFNNLLTAMIGFCDLLLIRHPAGDQSFADIMQIKQNANRAANLVRQLLAFSRKQTLRPEVVSITDTLADLANLIRRLIGENIELKLQHGRDIWVVKVDQGQLEQVIINLAVNARDAMGKGGILGIRTENTVIDAAHPIAPDMISPAEDDSIVNGEYVIIEVSDTGHGITPEIMRKIFEPFFSTKEVGAGTGLGLSTVYGIVKQTGGYIYVQSKIGEGTRFCIFLKRCQESDMAGETPAPEASESEASNALDLTGAGTLLLVEDEAPVRIFSARALRNKGYKVLEADCADAALKLVEEHKGQLDAIVTDVVMPGMTGPAMVEIILKQYPDIKVIFMSGYAEDAFVKTYGSERSFNFLPKPFSLKQLAGKVKEILG